MTNNGSDFEGRLTRLENLLIDFTEAVATDHRQMLTAQILLTDEVRKTSAAVGALAVRVDQLVVRLDQLAVRVDQVEGQVEALVKIVDGTIRDPGER